MSDHDLDHQQHLDDPLYPGSDLALSNVTLDSASGPRNLAASRPTEDPTHYHGQLLQYQFIAGLPQQLSFYVRARGPPDHATALTEALIGEAHGYRLGTDAPTIPAVTAAVDLPQAKPSQISALESQIAELTKAVAEVSRGWGRDRRQDHTQPQARRQYQQYPEHRPARVNSRITNQRGCFKCEASGHTQLACNKLDGTETMLDLTCSTCGQRGHGTTRCRLRNLSQEPSQGQQPLNGRAQDVGSRHPRGQ